MSDEQTMPEVIYASKGPTAYNQWQTDDYDVMPDPTTLIGATPYLRCDIDPDDAVVVSRNVMDKAKDIINNVNPELTATIATLTAERDAERASAMAFHVELQRLRMWCGEFVSRIEQRGVVGISDDADLVDIFREAALAQLKEQADD